MPFDFTGLPQGSSWPFGFGNGNAGVPATYGGNPMSTTGTGGLPVPKAGYTLPPTNTPFGSFAKAGGLMNMLRQMFSGGAAAAGSGALAFGAGMGDGKGNFTTAANEGEKPQYVWDAQQKRWVPNAGAPTQLLMQGPQSAMADAMAAQRGAPTAAPTGMTAAMDASRGTPALAGAFGTQSTPMPQPRPQMPSAPLSLAPPAPGPSAAPGMTPGDGIGMGPGSMPMYGADGNISGTQQSAPQSQIIQQLLASLQQRKSNLY